MIKINEKGKVYFACDFCGCKATVSPDGFVICSDLECNRVAPIRNINSFIEEYNNTIYVLKEIPVQFDNAIGQYIGRTIDDALHSRTMSNLHSNIHSLVSKGILQDYEISSNLDGTLDCKFSIWPSRPLDYIRMSLSLN